MAQYETTGGDIIITIPNCDCGLTGGCEKCQPIVLQKHPEIEYCFPETHEERFMTPDLVKFYKNKGY